MANFGTLKLDTLNIDTMNLHGQITISGNIEYPSEIVTSNIYFNKYSSVTPVLSIDTSGGVYQPRRPYIHGSPTNTGGGGIFNSFFVYSSRNMSFTGDRIIIPTTGTYIISFNTIADSSSTRINAYIYINGSSDINSLNDVAGIGFHYRSLSITRYCTRGDYIQFQNDDWYNSGVTTGDPWRSASIAYIG